MTVEERIAQAVAEERERCAKVADYWGSGKWVFQPNGRRRFDTVDCQSVVNTTARAIAEDIRKGEDPG